ncbi:MAG: hypothetical protein ACRELD_07200 [Longimicrobiales bacterium]
MILHCSFEELTALRGGIESVLANLEGGGVAAPPETHAELESLLPRLDSDLSLSSYAEQQRLERSVAIVLEHVHSLMDGYILGEYVGSENAVQTYFDYAYVLTVADRVRLVGEEMAAMIELVTGTPPSPESARSFSFPD